MITFSRFHHVFQLLKKYPPPISMNHDMSNNIFSIDPLSDVASDIQLLKPTTKYTLEQTTVLVECKGLTFFSTKPAGCCISLDMTQRKKLLEGMG